MSRITRSYWNRDGSSGKAVEGQRKVKERQLLVKDHLKQWNHPPPSRVDQHNAIGMATERSATTRLKDPPPRRPLSAQPARLPSRLSR